MSNARQIGLAMYEFEQKYGNIPDPINGEDVRNSAGTPLILGNVTSNDVFRKWLASGIAQSEVMFYAETKSSHRPDGVSTGAKALEKGECGFTYFFGATKTDNPKRPLVATPMIPGTDRFDPKPFKGMAVILRMDNCVTTLPIDKDGHITIAGRNLMDPHHPLWDGHAPVIAWPE